MADNSLTGGGVGVGVYESADGGVVIAGLEIVEAGLLVEVLANGAKMA